MKVTVSVHGRFHAFDLSAGLQRRGRLDRLLTTYPAYAAQESVGTSVELKTAPTLEIWRRLHGRFPLGPNPDLPIAERFGRFAAANLPEQGDILTGWSSATLEAIGPAHQRGMKVIVERGSTHIVHQTETLRRAYESLDLQFDATHPGIVDRELEEYARADYVSVPSVHAAETFVERGADRSKLLVNSLGVDMSQFAPLETRLDNPAPKIVFAGGVGVRKGVPWLLRAFADVASQAELHVYGRVEPGFGALLGALPNGNVYLHGGVSRARLARAFREADVFCLPSVEEGFGMVVGQAMASGLPVIVSSAVGAADLVTDRREGLIVPPMDTPALAGALGELIGDRDLRHGLGDAARARINSGYTWEDYIDRVVGTYESILGKSG